MHEPLAAMQRLSRRIGCDESDRASDLVEVRHQPRHFARRSRLRQRLAGACHAERLKQFAGHYLHGGSQVERGVILRRRDIPATIATLQRGIIEPAALRPEQDRHFPLREFSHAPIHPVPQRLRHRPQCAAAGAGTDNEAGVSYRLVQRVDHAHGVKYIERSGGARTSHCPDFALRCDQDEMAEPHHPHGSGARADIAGMGRPDENYRNIALHAHGSLPGFDSLDAIIVEASIVNPLLNIAISAARAGGAIALRGLNRLDDLRVERKHHNDYVSEIDRHAEQAIIEKIRKAHPDHAILAEESGESGGQEKDSEYQWIIDPLDGTTNYLHGFPAFAVSIAVTERGRLAHGVVYDPLREDMYVASRGRGALLNDRRIRVARRKRLEGALIGTGFPFRDFSQLDEYLAMFRAVARESGGIRRAGAAALDLAWVASGQLDGFFELDLKPWDIAAGCLLIEEAGGEFGHLGGRPGWPIAGGNILAGNPRVCTALGKTLAPHLPERLKPSK